MSAQSDIPPDCLLPSRLDRPLAPAKNALSARALAKPTPEPWPDVIIRPALPADTEAVSRMLARSYRALLAPDYEPGLLRDALPLIGQARPSLLTCGTYFIAEDGERVLAAGGWTDFSPHGAPGRAGEGHIRHVATDPDAARQGLGQRILRRILRSARAAEVKVLHCQSTLTAEPFYEALGFEMRAHIDVRLPTGLLFPAVQMRWQAEA
ncbi:GNAT family N-acetyltransferase [Pseudooceanicola spongiae]|jgi:GNAT superfamily N-acetyltransferase|uniref:GNAT family N-acetyltransferase n=1 Tax=Pseudooceanicola spongiae TaxID=2613965 RepID=A0A7L9WPY5_9RHOB|nr:GNAT family N-acetyltransferase [Pseudooceanicola spongiae]QOL81578.1 GNAT family N-acetyltransferase [Pseudooceanicola spongiae]